MNTKNIEKLKELLPLKQEYERFISTKGTLSCWFYSKVVGSCNVFIHDDEFFSTVKNLAKEKLKEINKQIEEL